MLQFNCKPFFVIEGNIGAGKSTLLHILSNNLPVEVVTEPVHLWRQDVQGQSPLDSFYANPGRWAYTFQTYACITRLHALEQARQQDRWPIIISDRSLFSDRYCFAFNAYEQGYMSPMEWHMYTKWFDEFATLYQYKPTGFIYLDTDPTICLDRINARLRNEEQSIPLAYLQQLQSKHHAWLLDKQYITPSIAHIPVLHVPCNDDFEHNKESQRYLLSTITDFIKTKIHSQPHLIFTPKEACL